MAFSFQCAAMTHIGNRRKNNEDNFFIGDGGFLSLEEQRAMSQQGCRSVRRSAVLRGVENHICAVSDGMGGHRDGEVASNLVVKTLARFTGHHPGRACVGRKEKYAYIQAFQDMVYQTNEELLGPMGDFDPNSMGATMTGVLIFADEAVSFNIGDSATFLYEDGFFRKLTVDDNETEYFRNTGAADVQPNRKRLTKYFGMPRSCGILTAKISIPVPLRSGQIYLMASDGLTDCLGPGKMAEIVGEAADDPGAVPLRLVEAALNQENSGHDNITVVAVKTL